MQFHGVIAYSMHVAFFQHSILRTSHFAVLLMALCGSVAVAQIPGSAIPDPIPPPPIESPAVRFNMNASLSDDSYFSNGISSRLPGNVGRLMMRPTLTLYDQIYIPVEIYATSAQQQGYQQPFNQIGVNPRCWDWMVLHGGYFPAYISDFTFGDIRMNGEGIELTPGKWRISALYGEVQRPLEPDTNIGFYGAYKRTMWAAKLGYGRENATYFALNMSHALDDAASIIPIVPTVAPYENLVVSMSFGSQIADVVRFYGEVGVSAFSNSILIPEVPRPPAFPSKLIETGYNILTSIFKLRTSSQVDEAAKFGIAIIPSSVWSVRLNTQYIGPGFNSLGYALLPNDVWQTTIAPTARLFNNHVYLHASAGFQVNNLRNTRSSTTQRIIGSLNSNMSFDEHLGCDVQYSNYGMKSGVTTSSSGTSTTFVDNIFQSVSVGPRAMFPGWGGMQSVMVTWGFQDLGDNNPVTALMTRSQSQSLMGIWSYFLPSTLNFSANVFANYYSTAAIVTHIVNVSGTVGKQFFENKLLGSITGGWGVVAVGGHNDGQLIMRALATYQLPRVSFTLNFSTNNYQYAVPNALQSNYNETMLSLTGSMNI